MRSLVPQLEMAHDHARRLLQRPEIPRERVLLQPRHPACRGGHALQSVCLPPQLVRGELECLQPDMWWGHAEPSRPVHTAGTLQIGAGLGQPVSSARALQPPGLPHSELPTRVEHWALGRVLTNLREGVEEEVRGL